MGCAAAIALALAATGAGAASAATGDPAALQTVTTALRGLEAQGSMSFVLSGRLRAGRDRIIVRSTGIQSTSGTPKGDQRATVTDGKVKPQRSRTIVLDRDVYTTVPALFRDPGDKRTWLHSATEDGDDSHDPAVPFRFLAQATSATRIGRMTVRERATTGYRIVVDYRRIARSGPPALRKAAREQAKAVAGGVERDEVWIDDEGLVRRVRLVQSNPKAKMKLTATIDALAYGVSLDGIVAPPAAKVIEEDELSSDLRTFTP